MTNITKWKDYLTLHNGQDHSVVGSLKVYQMLRSPQLKNERDILVCLPPSYSQSERHYPVIYMQDGQNLFDQEASYAGEWQVDETMAVLTKEGLEAIIVGIPNAGRDRLAEYSPFPDMKHGGGRGDDYLAFVVNTVKPLIDQSFRSRPEREHTGIFGSSMGGLISLYAYFRHSQCFGFAGMMSPSVWFARPALSAYLRAAPFIPGKLYLDVGTQEYSYQLSDRILFRLRSRRYVSVMRLLRKLLQEMGYQEGRDLRYVEDKGAGHSEAAWARRLPEALRFLLGG